MIPRVKLEYQIARAIFMRLVGEYDLSESHDLRDETRTSIRSSSEAGSRRHRVPDRYTATICSPTSRRHFRFVILRHDGQQKVRRQRR